jgi:DNA-binding response OmpR family regulator
VLTFRAIVAENDPIVRHGLDAALARLGGTVQLAASGWELLSLLADDGRIDVVVADVRMPMPGGVDALVMARTAGVTVPFVLVAAHCDERLRSTARKLHAVVIAKPVHDDELALRVRELVADAAPA